MKIFIPIFDLHHIFYIIKLLLWVSVVIVLLNTKDFWVELFAKADPELGGLLTWVLLLILLLSFIPRFDRRKLEKKSQI